MARHHETSPGEQQPRRRTRIVAAVLGATILGGALSACDPETSVPSTIQSMVGISKAPSPALRGDTVTAELDCRHITRDNASGVHLTPRIIIDGRVGKPKFRTPFPNSIWHGEITTYYDGSDGESHHAPLWVTAHYMTPPHPDQAFYRAGEGPVPSDTGMLTDYRHNEDVGGALRLPNNTEVIVSTTDVDNQLSIACGNNTYLTKE